MIVSLEQLNDTVEQKTNLIKYDVTYRISGSKYLCYKYLLQLNVFLVFGVALKGTERD